MDACQWVQRSTGGTRIFRQSVCALALLFQINLLATIHWLFVFVLKTFFLSAIEAHSKIEKKVQRFPIHCLPPHVLSLLHYQHPPPEDV